MGATRCPRPLPIGWYGHLHNIYLQYAAERGIPTMLMMMWMLLQILFDFWKGFAHCRPAAAIEGSCCTAVLPWC